MPGRRGRGLGATGLMAAAAVVIPLTAAGVLAAVGKREWADEVRGRLHDSPAGWAALAAAYAVIGGFALLPTLSLSLFAGYALGFGAGLPVTVVGFTGAAWISYAVAGRASGPGAIEAVRAHPRWRAVHKALLDCGDRRTTLIVALLRLPTFPPFGATSVALAALNVRRGPYLLGTGIGVVPRTALYVWLASRLNRFDPHAGEDWVWLIVSAATTLVVLAVVTMIGRHALKRLTGGPQGFPVVTDEPA
ncbi:MAG TPA: VTT domain-containing protein [Humisphaera sp.]